MLIVEKKINDPELKDAIENTFKHRDTELSLQGSFFIGHLQNDKSFEKQWRAFLSKINAKEAISFNEVSEVIIKRVKSLFI